MRVTPPEMPPARISFQLPSASDDFLAPVPLFELELDSLIDNTILYQGMNECEH